MGATTGIEWTTSTFNPFWGCTKISAECKNCYASVFDRRIGGTNWGPGSRRRFFGEKHWNEPLRWNREAKASGAPWRVFCASMADVFEELPAGHADTNQMKDERARLFRLIEATPSLTWLLLTKRPENISKMLPHPWLSLSRQNVWFGTSVGVPETRERLHHLSLVPAAVHFISVEPLLADVGDLELEKHHIEWVITGGESGAGARPLDAAWVRGVRDQCKSADVALFHKQWGKPENNPLWEQTIGRPHGERVAMLERLDPIGKGGSLLDGEAHKEFPRAA